MTRVLFVTYDFPYPLNSGGKNRAYNMMKYALGKDTKIDLISFVRDEFNLEDIEEIKKIGVDDVTVFKRKKLKSGLTFGKNLISKESIFRTLYFDPKFFATIQKIINDKKIEIVHFESSYTGYYIGSVLKKMGVKQVLGTENIEHLLYKEFLDNTKNILKKASLGYQIERFKKEEILMMKGADLCIAVTDEEAEYIAKITNEKCDVVENAVSVNDLKFRFSEKSTKNILFVGNFTYMPNISALKYFINDVMPILDNSITLTVIGRRVNEFVPKVKRINSIEYVDDVVKEYRKADLMIFPIKLGGGTNYKVLEAMALGVPIVGFSEKIETTGARAGSEYFKVENSQDFKKTIELIVNDKKIAKPYVKKARRLVEEKYSWEKVGLKLSKIWRRLNEEN